MGSLESCHDLTIQSPRIWCRRRLLAGACFQLTLLQLLHHCSAALLEL
jgi:hypothetical protein